MLGLRGRGRARYVRMLVAVVGAAIAHPRDRVVLPFARAVGSARAVGRGRSVRVRTVRSRRTGCADRAADTATGARSAAVACVALASTTICGVRGSTTTGTAPRLGRWHVGLCAPTGGARPTRALGDGFDDLGLRRAGVPRARRLRALGRPLAACSRGGRRRASWRPRAAVDRVLPAAPCGRRVARRPRLRRRRG